MGNWREKEARRRVWGREKRIKLFSSFSFICLFLYG